MDKKYLIDTSEFQENNMEFLFFGNDNDNVNININSNQNNVNNINNLEKDNSCNIYNDINNNKNITIINNNNNSSDSENKNVNSIHYQKTNALIFVNEITNLSQNEKKESGTIFSKHKDIKKVTLNDFKILKVLGRGTLGKVCLCKYYS